MREANDRRCLADAVKLIEGTPARGAAAAIVHEEDTYQVLSADPRVRDPAMHPVRIMTALHAAPAASPGAVLVRAGDPIRMMAIVHDLDRDPSWTEGWITGALHEVFAQCRRRGIAGLHLEPLGTVHGSLAPARFRELLDGVLQLSPAGLPRTVWIGRAARGTRAE